MKFDYYYYYYYYYYYFVKFKLIQNQLDGRNVPGAGWRRTNFPHLRPPTVVEPGL